MILTVMINIAVITKATRMMIVVMMKIVMIIVMIVITIKYYVNGHSNFIIFDGINAHDVYADVDYENSFNAHDRSSSSYSSRNNDSDSGGNI